MGISFSPILTELLYAYVYVFRELMMEMVRVRVCVMESI